jgi:hypothetical protein
VTDRLQVLLHSRPHAPSGSGQWSVAAMYNLLSLQLLKGGADAARGVGDQAG